MKKLILFTAIIFTGFLGRAQFDYDSNWEQVKKFENERKPKSALAIISVIETNAIAEKNIDQEIKAFFHQSKHNLETTEEAKKAIIEKIEKRIKTSSFPLKNILYSHLASMFNQYVGTNSSQIYNRTFTDQTIVLKDFELWDIQTFSFVIDSLYTQSLAQTEQLKSYPVSNLPQSVLISREKSFDTSKTVLYEPLKKASLYYYKSDGLNVTKPKPSIDLSDPKYLDTYTNFLDLQLNTTDTSSFELKTLQCYQDLMEFYQTRKRTHEFIQMDVKRLSFLYDNGASSEGKANYLKSLEYGIDQFKTDINHGMYLHKKVNLMDQEATYYENNIKDKTYSKYKDNRKKAVKLYEDYLATFDDEDVRIKREINSNLRNLKYPKLELKSEKYIPVQQPNKMLISYKNLDTLLVNSYKITRAHEEQIKKEYWMDHSNYILNTIIPNSESIHSESIILENKKDFLSYSVEAPLPKFNSGIYMITTRPTTLADNQIKYSIIHVTNHAVVNLNNTDELYISHRVTGKPLKNIKVKAKYYTRGYDSKKLEIVRLTSDANGKITLPKTKRGKRETIIETKEGDHTSYFQLGWKYTREEKDYIHDEKKTFLFTDRSIYRPGQTVYFKGITIHQKEGKSEAVSNAECYVYLQDVNGKNVGSIDDLYTNEFGSFSGSFVLPTNGLNGSYSIRSSVKGTGAYSYFRVEEYKRPKFFANFDPITQNVQLNDSVKVTGLAESYAGGFVSGAKVTYTISKSERFRDWSYYWYTNYNYRNVEQVKFGETETKADGTFEIDFKTAFEDASKEDLNKIYQYTVTADVIDINGETKSISTNFLVGNKSLEVGIIAPTKLNKVKKDHLISISSYNLNGQPLKSNLELKIFKLKAPKGVYRARPWSYPTLQNWTEEEYVALFPHESFSTKDELGNRKQSTEVFSSSFETNGYLEVKLDKVQSWKTGHYIAIVSGKDKSGEQMKTTRFFEVTDALEKRPADNQLFELLTDKSTYKVGEKVQITLRTSAKELNVLVQVEKDNKKIIEKWMCLKGGSKKIELPIKEEHLGGFQIHYGFAYQNSFVTNSKQIYVAYPATQLKVETLTFRDKISPGAKETWKFKIKGPKGEKVSAELLATLYDQSLDEFSYHNYSFNPTYHSYSYSRLGMNGVGFTTNSFSGYDLRNYYYGSSNYLNDRSSFNRFGFNFGTRRYKYLRSVKSYDMAVSESSFGYEMEDDAEVEEAFDEAAPAPAKRSYEVMDDLNPLRRDGYLEKTEENDDGGSPKGPTTTSQIVPRKNLQETAFFYPHLQTDENGDVTFSFTSPEAMTTWKLLLLGHTKDLNHVTYSLSTKTQKELFVTPNAPRFFREGDQLIFQSKVSNLTENKLKGETELVLFDGLTNENISSKLITGETSKSFSMDAKGNAVTSWTLTIPDGLQGVKYQVMAKAGDFTDGEESFVPVLTNRRLVTETMPIWVRSNETKTFTLEKLKTSTSTTLKHHQLTLEMTSNPSWYAVQSLPYLMEYPYECAEQTFSRYYANAIGQHIVNSNPRIKEVFNQWKSKDQLISNLEKNQELKSILIEETPWLRDAQSETEQQKRIALLFDVNQLSQNINSALNKLKKKQLSNGAWSWFDGGYPSRYITQHIIQGFGHLKQIGIDDQKNNSINTTSALNYLEKEYIKDYEWTRDHVSCLECNHLSSVQLQYLYMTYLWNVKPSKKAQEATDYYLDQIESNWTQLGLYNQGLATLIASYYDDSKTSKLILESLKERAIQNPELGMYWKENTNSWNWYESDIETQALLIEVFTVLENDIKTIDELKVWLLKNKQTNRWKTTKATTEAVYALLMKGTDWISETKTVEVQVAGETIDINKLSPTAGTGYFKTSWKTSDIKPEMATVKVSNPKQSIAWGGMYWQYFEDLDKITSAKTPLTLEKKLFLKTNTSSGEKLIQITPQTEIKIGDLITVRIVLTSDRDMEFVHMKDMRSSGLEPTTVLSRYKWQDGLGYYQQTKDASTNFFFDNLSKGKYVFEYDLRANNAGNFSNGITTIQSMYAPEFSSHSEGVRLSIQ